MSPRATIRSSVPGPKSIELRKREEAHLAPGLQGFATMAGIAVKSALGSQVTDVDGNTFIDFIGGIGVNGLGHRHPKYVSALHAQLEKVTVGSFTSEARVELLERLALHRPSAALHRVQLYSSGAEAVESALRLAKSYTGKYEFVSFWGGFHGKTQGALSLNGTPLKENLGPMVAGAHVVPYANCYRCPVSLKYPTCALACVELARKQIRASSAGRVAAVVIEPMQGTSGNVVPPPDFMRAVKDLARELGALLIVDEMITGFGRTGRYWGVEHSAVEPDIVTIGKQFGGGYPVAAIISRDDIVAAKPWSEPSGSSSSYGGNPMASAAAAAALAIIDEENLVANSAAMGARFLNKTAHWVDRYPFVGEIRGLGLFLGIDLVSDRVTRRPLEKAICRKIFDACLRRGLLTMAYAPSFRLQPAMTIDAETLDEGLGIIEDVFDLALSEGWSR